MLDEYIKFAFEIKNKWTSKYFSIWYEDSESKEMMGDRPLNHYYHLDFEQLITQRDQFVTMEECKWYTDEEDILYRIRSLANRRKYG